MKYLGLFGFGYMTYGMTFWCTGNGFWPSIVSMWFSIHLQTSFISFFQKWNLSKQRLGWNTLDLNHFIKPLNLELTYHRSGEGCLTFPNQRVRESSQLYETCHTPLIHSFLTGTSFLTVSQCSLLLPFKRAQTLITTFSHTSTPTSKEKISFKCSDESKWKVEVDFDVCNVSVKLL